MYQMKEKTGVAKSAEEIRFLEDRDTIQQLTGTIADLSAAIARKDAVISCNSRSLCTDRLDEAHAVRGIKGKHKVYTCGF